VLTEVRAVYRDHCSRVMPEVEEADLAASEHSLMPRGRPKVNAPVTFGFLYLGPLVPEFLASHPAIRLELTLNDRGVELLAEGFDLTRTTRWGPVTSRQV
jgi:DNA-binding transcriptional LysR family regulator